MRDDVLMGTKLFNRDYPIKDDFDLICRLALKGPFRMARKALIYIHRREENTPDLSE